jgi:beta-phosphoglucomutase-like phosphatase (HAD superfamily)
MLGLDETVEACLFDLDGVLTNSAALHAWAWSVVFDELLLRSSVETGWHFIPFAPVTDYRAFIDGRPRLEGVHAFLDSRGIRLPEGRVDDPPDARTACGLARRKGDLVVQGLRRRGVTAFPGVRRYLEAAGRAGLKRAVVSASANARPMLELAGLAPLVEVQADADLIRSEGARTAPAPDLLLAACRRLEVAPESSVALTHSAAGVAAGRTAGMIVVGVGEGAQADLLRGVGADRVVASLAELLDPRLL